MVCVVDERTGSDASLTSSAIAAEAVGWVEYYG
jgi:hypothetical protein